MANKEHRAGEHQEVKELEPKDMEPVLKVMELALQDNKAHGELQVNQVLKAMAKDLMGHQEQLEFKELARKVMEVMALVDNKALELKDTVHKELELRDTEAMEHKVPPGFRELELKE